LGCVWLVRHAASTLPSGLAIGFTDPALSNVGRVQAHRVALELAVRPLVRILSSDLRRASETAGMIAMPHRLSVETTPALREIDFGAWEGRWLSDLWVDEPASAAAWEQNVGITPPSFGESLGQLEHRVAVFWDSLQPLPSDGEVAIVAHGGSLAVLTSLITRRRIEDCLAMRLDPCGVVEVTFGSPQPSPGDSRPAG
jgi:broad specificity phosphatase PhoE